MDAASTQRRLRMCHGKHRGQYQSDTTTEQVWQKLTPEMVLMLLEEAAYAARYQAKALLDLMENHVWLITAARAINAASTPTCTSPFVWLVCPIIYVVKSCLHCTSFKLPRS
jgi:hypothetical protein